MKFSLMAKVFDFEELAWKAGIGMKVSLHPNPNDRLAERGATE